MTDSKPDIPPGTIKKPKSRLWLWLKRGLLGIAALLLVLMVFHRPILRFTVDRAAHYFASKAGYELEWLLQGSVVSDLSLNGLKVSGPADGVVSSVQWGEASLDYSLWSLIREGPGRFLNRLVLKDAEIVVDLRKQKPKVGEPPPKKKSSPPDFWLQHLELRNVTLRVIAADGEILIKKFTLVVSEGSQGVIALEELALPGNKLHLVNVKGGTSLEQGWIRFTDLEMLPGFVFRRLGANIGELKAGRLPVDVDLQSGDGSLQISGSLEGLGGEGLALDLALGIKQLRESEVARWVPLPEGMTWQVNEAAVQIRGKPGEPRSLLASLSLDASEIQTAGVKLDRFQSRLTLQQGRLDLAEMQARAGENTVDLKGQADLPERWNEVARSAATVDLVLKAPALESLLPDSAPVRGGLSGGGTVSVKDGLLAAANLKLESKDLVVSKASLSSFTVEVESDAKEVRVKGINAKLDEQNGVTLAGTIQLEGRQKTELTLRLEGTDLSTLSQLKDLAGVYPPAGGVLSGSVTARFDMADLREKNLKPLTAEGTVDVIDLQWNQGTLQKAALQFGYKEDLITLRRLDIDLDDQNQLKLAGDLLLRAEQPANLTWEANFQQISSLTAWVRSDSSSSLPPPQAGVLVSRGKAAFRVADLKAKRWEAMVASMTIGLSEVQWLNASLENADFEVSVQGGKVEAAQLLVKLDAENQVSGKAGMSLIAPHEFSADIRGELKELASLSAWMELFNKPAIGSGAVSLSWRGTGSLRPLAVRGNGTVSVTEFSMEGNPNKYSLALETRHEGSRAELTRLEAQFGKFRLEAAGSVSDTDLEMTRLALFSGDVSLAGGSVAIPLVLNQTPRPKVPIDPARPLKVDLQMKRLKFEELFRALGMKKAPVGGSGEASIAFAGKLSELKGTLEVNLHDVDAAATKGKLDSSSARLVLNLVPGKVDLQAQVVQKPLQPLELRASLPLEMAKVMEDPSSVQNAPLTAEVTLPESDLGFVPRLVPALANVRGKVSAHVKLDGPLRSPSWRGALQLNIPTADLRQTPMSIRDVKARITFVEKKITLEDVSAILAGGEIRASGGIDVTDLAKPEINVRVIAKQALIVRDDTMSLRADGNVAINGPLNGASVSGRVELVRGRVFKEIEFLPLSLPNQLPPPPPPVKRSGGKPSAPPPFDKWNLDVDVVTRDPIRLLGNVLNGGVVVNLHAGGTGGALEVTGKASLENARVQLPFSRLAISRGDVIFTKERPLDPELDLQGDSLVGNYVVTLFAYGPALSPKVRFTSNPPLPEGEIATLLATGSSAGDLTSSEGVAANRAAFLLLSQTYRKVFRKASPKRLDEDPPKLSFSFSPLSTGNTQRAVTATYEVSPHLQAIGEFSERGTFRGLLHYLVRFR